MIVLNKNDYNKNELSNKINSFQIATTYIGTVVGAGFASGQEVLQFFGYYGVGGFIGLILTTLLFIIYGYIILSLGKKFSANSYLEVIRYAGGKWLVRVIDLIISIFLFGVFTTMVAGSGAIFSELLGIPSIWGNLVMITAALSTAILGIGGVVSAISYIVPLLIFGIFFMVIKSIMGSIPITLDIFQKVVTAQAPIFHWSLSAIIYVSYNLIIAIAVLAPLGAEIEDDSKLKKGAILGGIGLGTGGIAILFILLLYLPEVSNFEVPMSHIAGKFAPWFQIGYSLILLTEIYTTAVSNLYGFVIRLTDNNYRYKMYLYLTSIGGLIVSQAGFSNLVYYLYPVVGYVGILLMVGLTLGYIRARG